MSASEEIDERDAGLIMEILRFVEEKYDDPDEAKDIPTAVFGAFLARGRPLSAKQRAWVKSVHERIFDKPEYENLISRGLAPRGKEVPAPPVLQNLPKKPPQRRRNDE